MTASRVRLVSVVWLLALLVIVLATWAAMTDPRAGTTWEEVVLVIAFGFGFTTVGAILVTRRPREPVGRIALLIGLVTIAAAGLRSVASSRSASRSCGTACTRSTGSSAARCRMRS